MQCPACGYEGDADEACFCSRCRHQYRVPDDGIVFDNPSDLSSEQREAARADQDAFTEKEIRFIRVLLIQPAVLLMVGIAAGVYLSSSRISQLSIPAGGYEIPCGAFLSLAIGFVLAWIFYLILAYRIEHA